MTVKELIEKLLKIDNKDLIVVVPTCYSLGLELLEDPQIIEASSNPHGKIQVILLNFPT